MTYSKNLYYKKLGPNAQTSYHTKEQTNTDIYLIEISFNIVRSPVVREVENVKSSMGIRCKRALFCLQQLTDSGDFSALLR